MGEGSQGPYRQKSLERLSSPERLDQLLRLVDRKSWLPLATLSVLVAVLVAWSIFGRVPVNAHGRGILVRPREVVEIEAPGDGYLTALQVRVGDRVEAGAVLGRIDRPDLEKELALQRDKARQLMDQFRTAAPGGRRSARSAGRPADLTETNIRRHLEASRAVAEQLREEESQAILDERRKLVEQIRLARALSESQRSRFDARRKLHEQGIVATEALVEAEVFWTESLEHVADLEVQLWTLRTRELEVEDQFLKRLERIADREQQFADVRREIERLQILHEEQATIVSEHAGRILELSVLRGEYLEAGDRIGSVAISDPSSPFVSLAYFTVRDGKRMRPGMPIQVTPDPVERERYGSIVGTVVSISGYPVTQAEAEKEVGNREIAGALTAGGYRMRVVAELETDPTTFSKFRWSSSRGPELEITAGTTTTARVPVDRRAPITFVLPFLRTSAGID
jgi:HlyD family secretion protein